MRLHPLKHLIVCLFACLSYTLWGQHLAQYQVHTILAGQPLNLEIAALDYPQVLNHPAHGSINKYRLNFEDQYRLRYLPQAGYVGLDTIVYRVDPADGGAPRPRFEGVIVRVVDVNAQDDYYTLELTQEFAFLPVSSNDLVVTGTPVVTEIAFVQNGTAEITLDGTGINFRGDQAGYAHVEYLICADGHCASAHVQIRLDDPTATNQTSHQDYEVVMGESATILLPPDHEPPGSAYYNGTLEKISYQIYRYTPRLGDLSTTELRFAKWSINHYLYSTARITVIDPFAVNGWNHDDIVFTEVGNPVDFNVLNNDIGDQVDEVFTDQLNGTLTELHNGFFRFVPDPDFNGETLFSYRTCDQGRCDTAQVLVTVHDFTPRETYWHFNVIQNEPLTIDYQIPIDEYHFEILSTPAQGHLRLTQGDRTLLYSPDLNYVGSDVAVLKYCAVDNDCEPITIIFNVLDLEDLQPCSSDCMWPGDANDDGTVSIGDIMPLGLNLGRTGPARSSQDWESWWGCQSEPWTHEVAVATTDLRHVDGDGDGFITTNDIEAIDVHYGQSHRLVPELPLSLHQIPIELKLMTPEVAEGEQAILQISLGDGNGPFSALGINFSVEVNPHFIDSSSLQFHLAPNQLVDANAGTLSYTNSPRDGRLDVGVVKTDRQAVVKHGVLGTVTFIVEEDLNGFRSAERLAQLAIEVRDIHILNAAGEPKHQKSIIQQLSLVGDSKEIVSKLNYYPNPASSHIVLESPLGIASYRLRNLQGMVVLEKTGLRLPASSIGVELPSLPNGLYLLEMEDLDGQIELRKIQIMR